MFGSDYPFAHFPYATAIENIIESPFLNKTDIDGIFFENVKSLFAGDCACGH